MADGGRPAEISKLKLVAPQAYRPLIRLMTQQPARICILGGGFGGLYTALRLSQLPWEEARPEIVLVDRSDRFLFSPLLYELLYR